MKEEGGKVEMRADSGENSLAAVAVPGSTGRLPFPAGFGFATAEVLMGPYIKGGKRRKLIRRKKKVNSEQTVFFTSGY